MNSESKVLKWVSQPLAWLPTAKVLLHLVTLGGYGYFRDEFYYIVGSGRLAFGYVDHPPFSLLVLRVFRTLFGESLFAVRLPSALAGGMTILLVGLMCRQFGGGRFAQTLAMLATATAPVFLSANHTYSMNAIDILLWALSAYLLVKIVKGGDVRLWLVLGLVLGVGLQNKLSFLWLGAGLLAGLLGTGQRKWLTTRWPWLAAAIASLVFLPHVLWQIRHGWPTVEFIRNATTTKMVAVAWLPFVESQFGMMNWVSSPIWLCGLFWLLAGKKALPFRLLAWIYLAVLVILILNGASRPGYLAPAYTWLFAAGAAWIEPWFLKRTVTVRTLACSILLLVAAAEAPFSLPLLRIDRYIAYARLRGIDPSTDEKKELGALPQHYADMHGWEAIVDTAAEVHGSLQPAERARATFFTFNYGDAGAIDVLGASRGLPAAISGHNNYWIWGPGPFAGDVVIVLGSTRESLSKRFNSVEQAATIDCGLCMPYENNRTVWVCREPKHSLHEIWSELKHYD